VELSLEEAAQGKEVKVEFPRAEHCDRCSGSGAEPGTKKSVCPECHGHGEIRVSQGFFAWRRTCPRCQGDGEYITKACQRCRGSGRIRKTRKLNIKIPAGIEHGSQLKIAGEGEAGARGGSRGHLYVSVGVKPHPVFGRSGNDVLLQAKIGIHQAALGAEIEIPTLDGKVRLKIPSGTQPGRVFRVKGKGIRDLHGYGVGDQLVRVTIDVPERLSSEERKLLEAFGKLRDKTHKGKDFFSRWTR